jgi:hypothetical protein
MKRLFLPGRGQTIVMGIYFAIFHLRFLLDLGNFFLENNISPYSFEKETQ